MVTENSRIGYHEVSYHDLKLSLNMPLTAEVIHSAQPGVSRDGRVTHKPYKIYDKRGLYLLVSPAGGKWWRFNYRFFGKHKTVSCGVYPEISLEQARERRDAFRALLAEEIDPSQHLKEKRAARLADGARRLGAIRFTLDSNGALAFCLGNRCLTLTAAETGELRAFLDATRAVPPKVPLCP
jgi:hypothetical protein